MKPLFPLGTAALALACVLSTAAAQEATAPPKDSRLGKPKDYNGYFPWTAPTSLEEWQKRRQVVREQVLAANGLWPLPEKTHLKPIVHGWIQREDYSIARVYFASYPGHYVTGNLYWPTGRKAGKKPGVLFAHGHWANARLSVFSDKVVEAELKSGAEKTKEGAKYIFQALCVQLARMGCYVFHYDMVGNSDSTQIAHAAGFRDAEAELRLQSAMGLQTWNSVRALDFLLSQDEVDPTRIGMTGASGGGTQTFILAAIDDRLTAAFPAVMVSTGMQGGCVCENASYLRVGTNNIEIAGLFAPRPLAMSGANDWTIKIETDGLPQLKSLYRLYGAEDRVAAKTWPEFGHNYNQHAREMMYRWFKKHLKLDEDAPVTERPFVPVPPKELSVWTDGHKLPADGVNAEGLRRYLTEASNKQLEKLLPRDRDGLKEMRRVLGSALRTMITDALPGKDEVKVVGKGEWNIEGPVQADKVYLSRAGQNEAVPGVWLQGPEFDGTAVVMVHPDGIAGLKQDGPLSSATEAVRKAKGAILAVDVYGVGELGGKLRPVNKTFAGYTFGYNRPIPAERAHDILTAVAYARSRPGVKRVHLVGFGKAGPWVVLARGLCGDAVERTAADLNGFRFEQVLSMNDEMMLPGALKYGGLPALAALIAPHELYLHNAEGSGTDRWLRAAYEVEGQPGRLQRHVTSSRPEDVVAWLLR